MYIFHDSAVKPWVSKRVGYADTTVADVYTNIISLSNFILTPWFMEPGGSIPHSQGLSYFPYPEPNQPNSPH